MRNDWLREMDWAHVRKAQLYEYEDGPAKHQIRTSKERIERRFVVIAKEAKKKVTLVEGSLTHTYTNPLCPYVCHMRLIFMWGPSRLDHALCHSAFKLNNISTKHNIL